MVKRTNSKTKSKSSRRKSVTKSSRSSYASSPPPMYIPPPSSSSSSGGMGPGMILMIVLALLIFAGIGYVLMYPDEGQRVLNVLGFGATTKAAVRRKTDDGMSTGAIVGIVILALLVIGGIIYFFMNRGGPMEWETIFNEYLDGIKDEAKKNELNEDLEKFKYLVENDKKLDSEGKANRMKQFVQSMRTGGAIGAHKTFAEREYIPLESFSLKR